MARPVSMRILVLVTRYPWPHTKGDQQRAFSWICALAERHDVRVVTSGAPVAGQDAGRLPASVVLEVVPAGSLERALSALRAGARGAPLQVGWMMPDRAWRAATRAMADADVVLAMTTRSLRGRVNRPLVIDHVDALSLNMRRRSHGTERLPVRAFARVEAARFVSWERRCSRWASAAIATADEDAAALPALPRVEVLPVSIDHVEPLPAAAADRPIDVVLSGNMRYPPNRRAALLLDREIAPAIRRRLPDARLVVVGRAADTLGLATVEVLSDVPDVLAVLRESKIAIAPLAGGTGSPYKVLEAAACGAAIVSSPWAAERFGLAARTASDVPGYCSAVVDLLADPQARAALVAQSQAVVAQHRTVVLAGRVEAILVAAAAGSH